MTRTEIKEWLKVFSKAIDSPVMLKVVELIEADEMALREMTRFIKSVVPVMRESGKACDEILEELGIDEITGIAKADEIIEKIAQKQIKE